MMALHLAEARAWDAIEAARDLLTSLAQRLVRIDSRNPPGDEVEVVHYLDAWLGEHGLGDDSSVHERHDRRPNLLARIRGGGEATLALCGHTDTHPVGDADAWHHDPLSGDVIDGALYGRGAVDMKGALAAMTVAAWAVYSTSEPTGDVVLVFVGDEEAGGSHGAKVVSESVEFLADAMVIGEPCGVGSSFEYIGAADRGALRFDIVAKGTGMHSSLSYVDGCENAAMALARALPLLKERIDVNLEAATTSDPLFPEGPTVNLGLALEGGARGPAVPQLAAAFSEIRALPGSDPAVLKRVVKRSVAEVGQRLGLRISARMDPSVVGWIPGTRANTESPEGGALLRAASDAAQLVLRRPVPVRGFPGGTDAIRFATNHELPILPAVGPGALMLAHGPNEALPLPDLLAASKLYASLVLRFFDYLAERSNGD